MSKKKTAKQQTVPEGTQIYGFTPKGLMKNAAGTFRKGDLTGIFLTLPEGISIASAMRMLRSGLLKPEQVIADTE